MEKFIEQFALQFDETDTSDFNSQTRFREVEEWSSLTALCVISMIYDNYKIRLKPDEMRKTQTIQELYDLVISN